MNSGSSWRRRVGAPRWRTLAEAQKRTAPLYRRFKQNQSYHALTMRGASSAQSAGAPWSFLSVLEQHRISLCHSVVRRTRAKDPTARLGGAHIAALTAVPLRRP